MTSRAGRPTLKSVDATLFLLPCPEPTCEAPAEVTDRMTIGSTSGPVEHLRTLCVRGHRFFMPMPATVPHPVPRPGEASRDNSATFG